MTLEQIEERLSIFPQFLKYLIDTRVYKMSLVHIPSKYRRRVGGLWINTFDDYLLYHGWYHLLLPFNMYNVPITDNPGKLEFKRPAKTDTEVENEFFNAPINYVLPDSDKAYDGRPIVDSVTGLFIPSRYTKSSTEIDKWGFPIHKFSK